MRQFVPVAVLFVVASSGCSPTSIAKRGFKELKGASGKVLEVRPLRASDLRSYRSVRVGRIDNEIGHICPSGMLGGLKTSLPEHLAALKKVYPGGEPVLTVDVAVQYVQSGGGFGAVLGSDQYLISRVYLRGEETRPVGELVVVSHSEALRTSEEDMAKAASRSLTEYLKSKAGRRDR